MLYYDSLFYYSNLVHEENLTEFQGELKTGKEQKLDLEYKQIMTNSHNMTLGVIY